MRLKKNTSKYAIGLLLTTMTLVVGFLTVLLVEPIRSVITQAMVRAAVDGPYTGTGGYDYYVVNATIPAEDTGDEVCAAVGLTCIGYTLYDETVCQQVHPGATVDNTQVSGSKASFYCDGAPQGGVCAGLTNTCATCPTCNVGVSCSEPIGGLYREMYVQCGGAVGTNGYSAPLRPDDSLGDTNFVATTLTDGSTFNTYPVAHDLITDSDTLLFTDGYTDAGVSASAYDSLGGGVFVAHGHNNGGTGGRELYIAKINSAGAVLWDNLFSNYSFYYGQNYVIDMVDDLNGGVFVLAAEGAVFGPTNLAPVLYYFTSGGALGYSVSTFPTSNNIGRMIPDGSGGVFVLSDLGYDPNFNYTGPGTIRRYTTSGLDATYNSGSGFQEVIAGGADVHSIEMIPDDVGGIIVFWVGNGSGSTGLHAQHIESDGSIDTDFGTAGELIYADDSAYGPVEATIAGSHVYVAYTSSSGTVVNEFFLDLTTTWQCRQSVPSSSQFNIINPLYSSPILIWQASYGDGDAIFAQVFDAGTGHSAWTVGGEVLDASDNYTTFTSLGVALNGTPATTGFGLSSGGVEVVYTYDDGVGVPITTFEFDQSYFGSGSAGDCVPVQPPVQVLPADGATVSITPYLSAQYLAQIDFGVTHYRVSSSSTADCAANSNIVFSATSYTTESLDQVTGVIVDSGIADGNTYYWCAQNDDGSVQSDWVEMGDFTVDLTTPHPDYSTYLGGTFQDQPRSLVLDASGVLYVGGQTTSTDFPTTTGAYDETFTGNQDIFVAGIDPQAAGSADLVFATYVGGTDLDSYGFVRVDATNLYVVGASYSTDFPTTLGAYDTTNPSGLNITTISVLSLDATTLDYSTYYGNGNAVQPTDMDVEGGLIYLSGQVFGSNIPTTAGAFDTTLDTSNDAFLMVLSPDGAGAADLVYSTYFGGNHSNEYIVSLDVDAGLMYFGMYTQASNLSTTAGAFDTTYNAGTDTYVGVLDPAGAGAADLVYGSYLGGTSSNEQINGVAFDSGDIYITGYVAGGQPVTFPTTAGAYQSSYAGTTTVGFMTILNPGGAGAADLVYSTFIDGVIGVSVATDAGMVYVLGANSGLNTAITATPNAFDADLTSQFAIALVKIEPLSGGSADLLYGTLIESNDINSNMTGFSDGMRFDSTTNSVWFLANTTRGDYPTLAVGGDPYDYNFNGQDDTVITRITFEPGTPAAPNIPTVRFPDNAAVRAGTVILSAQYSHPGSVGTTEYRVASTNASDCLNNLNIADSGASTTTATNQEPTLFEVSPLADGTYFWCARNNDGVQQSAWTSMASFVKESSAPYVNYISYLGGTDTDSITEMDASSGTVYFVGTTGSTNLPTTIGVIEDTSPGGGDVFVGALDPSGNGTSDLEFLTYIGSTGADSSFSIRHSGSDLYIAGFTDSASFPTTGGAYDTSHNGATDAFAMRINDTGTSIEYSTYVGGTSSDALHIGEVSGGIMYLGGTTGHTSFPTTAGAYDTTYNGGASDNVIVILNPAGGGSTDLVYSTFMGGTSIDGGVDVAEFGGEIYFGSDPFSSNHPTTGGSYDTSNNGAADLVFGRLNPAGAGSADLEYSTFVGGSSNEFLDAFTIDQTTGEIYASGVATTGFPTTAGAYDTSFTDSEMFIVKFDTAVAGSGALEYSTYVGGLGVEFAADIAFDGTDVFVVGSSVSENSPITTATAYGNTRLDDTFNTIDGYLVRLTPASLGASDLLYASYFGLVDVNEQFTGVDLDGTLIYLVGVTQPYSMEAFSDPGTPFDSTPNGTDQDGFIMRIDLAGYTAPANSAPTAPTTLYTGNSDAQSGAANPTGITSSTPVFSAICNDPDSGDIMNLYRIQVDNNNDFSSVLWDSGAPGTAMANCVAGARSANITYGGAALTQDGATYYWRIKFWDDEPSEGAFSQAISTNTFTMATSGGGGGGGSSIQRLQELQTLASPVIGPATVLGPDSVRFEWSYGNTGNVTGFRLINDQNQVAVQVPSSTAIAATETGLPHNTVVSGRKVTAYNQNGESAPSSTYADEYTHMIVPQPALVSRENNAIVVEIESELNNLQVGLSAVQFELIPADTVAGVQTLTSAWVQGTEYTFNATEPGAAYLLRVRARNQIAFETPWSSTILIPGEELVPGVAQLSVGLRLTPSDGQNLTMALNPNSIIYGEVTVNNIGDGDADNVLMTLPIPEYINYIPGTLSVGGRQQTDAVDGDFGQNGNGVLSVIWPEIPFGFGQTVRFQLGFDTPRLVEEFVKPIVIEAELKAPLNETTQSINRVLAQAIATANPEIVLQAQASHQDDPNPVFSNEEQIQPDLTIIQPTLLDVPDEEPVIIPDPVVPTPEQVEIIENILQTEFPQSGQPAPVQPIPQGETTSNFEGGSFGMSTTDGNNRLTLNGFAQTNGDQIEFTGTSSEPFTVITLIFNDSITAIVVSDSNGNWQTFVSADQLGIAEGEEAQVNIEAIAAKGDLRSERVQIADVTVSRGIRGEIAADFETIVSEQGFISTLQRTAETVTETLQENEPEIQTTLVVSAPVVIASSVPLWGYLPYIPSLIYHFIAWLFGFVNRKKKDEDHPTFGVVYDAITKLPLPLAIVRIYSRADNKLAGTVVTDKLGRYDLLLAPGQYRFEVAKPQYQFPSSIVTTSIDGAFDRVYQITIGITIVQGSSALPHVPVDPINVKRQWELSFGIRKLWLAFQRLGNHLATPIMVVGFVTALALVYVNPARLGNWLMAGVYLITLSTQLKLKPKLLKAWGVVYDVASNAILPLVTIQLIEPATSKVVTSRLSDYEGRFTFLPEPGTYVVKASKPGFTQVTEVVQSPFHDRQPLPQTINVDKPSERVSGDIAMRQGT